MRWAMGIFGAANIAVSSFSFYYFAYMIEIHLGRWPGNPTRGEWLIFCAICFWSTLLVLAVAGLGVGLILGHRRALWLLVPVFLFEIVYEWLDIYVTWNSAPISMGKITVGFWGIADSGLETQVLSGYALLGLVVAITLLIIDRSRSRARNTVAG